MDLKEAVQAAAPVDDSADMPEDQAQRLWRARVICHPIWENGCAHSIVWPLDLFRELLPQDLKIELETLTCKQAMNFARFLANVVGKAHARQMDTDTRSKWSKELSTARPVTLMPLLGSGAGVVDLLAIHEKAYLEHCRLYALNESD